MIMDIFLQQMCLEEISLVVIFDMDKIVFFNYENCDNNRNPLNFCEYRGLEEAFTFTEQDYENAEDCNGNCE